MRDLTASQRKLRDDLLDEPLSRFSDLELIDRFVEMAEKVYGEEIDKILLETQGEPLCLGGGDQDAHPFTPGIDEDAPHQPDPRWCNTCGELAGKSAQSFDEWARYYLNGQAD